jgi:hypothetical protein
MKWGRTEWGKRSEVGEEECRGRALTPALSREREREPEEHGQRA